MRERAETLAQRATREWAERPTAARRPDAYAAELLALLGDVRNATAAVLNAARGLDLALAREQADVERLPDPAGDPRRSEHVEARRLLDDWLRPMRDGAQDRLEELPHAPHCADDRREMSEDRAASGYGVLAVRTWRCLGCGAQAVVNRRVIHPPDRGAERRQAQLEAGESAREPRWRPAPSRSRFA